MSIERIATILFLSVGLAMDAFSVCVSYGTCHKSCGMKSAFRLSFFTGLFQFIMPLAGWLGGNFIGNIFAKIGPWLAFILLTGLGIKMIIDSVLKKKDCEPVDISKGKHLIIACLATSIDALIAGFSFGIIKTPLIITVTSTGLITFILSLCGIYLGKLIGFILGKWAEIFGGIILIVLGIKVFF